ncbi:MAG: hypothetical protein AAB358_01565 [Patescibacteria group bacterium]
MTREMVKATDQKPLAFPIDWLRKYNRQKDELDKQLIRGLEEPGKGLSLDELQAFLEHQNPFKKSAISRKDRLFSTTEEQIVRILEINEAVWKNPAITAEAIKALGDPPQCPPSDGQHLYCVCLLFETGDPANTFRLNWEACVHIHGQDLTWKWDGLVFALEGVRQRIGAKPRPVGLHWRVCELGRRFKGKSVKNVRLQLDQSKTIGMGQELPMIAALHPKWAKSLNGQDKPFVDAPDLEVAPRGQGDFSDAPYLYFDAARRRVRLDARGAGYPGGACGSGSLR